MPKKSKEQRIIDDLNRFVSEPSLEFQKELESRCIELANIASSYRAKSIIERIDAERWRWLRQCRAWPESEAEVSGYAPIDFDSMADKFMGRKHNK